MLYLEESRRLRQQLSNLRGALMGHVSRGLEDNSTEISADYGNPV